LSDHLAARREEDDQTVAKKTGNRSATKKTGSSRPKAGVRPSGKAAKKPAAKAKATASGSRAAATARPASRPAGPTLGEHAERLRDEIHRSKLTHPDPWRYAAKARPWGERAQVLVELITVRGETAAARSSLEALVAELEADRDFQEARRLF
jgi:hypothetical protein